MGVLKILDGDREETHRWDPDTPQEVEAARLKVEHYRNRGFVVCQSFEGKREGGPRVRFDPRAEEIFMLRFVDGG
ncbi:MAG: hypothetical protein P1P84_23080 [Deferrisomatales bacterium]|nr:hypothetical protein [Deferrisomatales bacterium]